MSEQDATLKDGLVPGDPANPTPPESKDSKAAGAAETKPNNDATVLDTADKDAAELGRLLMESGYTRDKVNELLAAPGALQSIQNLVRNNPQEFLTMLERTDPEAARNFHEKMAELFVQRHQVRDGGKNGKGGKDGQDSELLAEIQTLREKVNQAETREQQREQLKAMAAIQARYNARVDELFSNDEIKKMGLTPSEQKAMRARLDSELARDPAAVQRLNNGNFFDVPRKFTAIIEEWGNDKKTVAAAEKAKRERAKNSGTFEFSSGPNPITVDPKSFDGSWEDTENALADAFEQAGLIQK